MDQQTPHAHLHAPMSQEAEQALLGAIIIDARVYLTVASILSAEDFFIKRHEFIWNALSRLQERNDAIDYLTLSRELQDMGVLDEIGGQAYLTSLVNNTPTAVHAEVYGEMVVRTSTRRKMLQAADHIRQFALDEELPIDKVIDEAEQALFAVSNSQVKREFVPIWDAASEYYDEMEKLLEIGAGTIGMPTGFNDLDGLLGGFQKSDLIVFAGRPGMGKTSWMLSVALNVARRDRRVAIFTMEMGVEQMVQRLISMETGIRIQAVANGRYQRARAHAPRRSHWAHFQFAAFHRRHTLDHTCRDEDKMPPTSARIWPRYCHGRLYAANVGWTRL